MRLRWRYRAAALAASVASTTAALLALRMVQRNRLLRRTYRRSRKPAKYRRVSLTRPVHSDLSTPWNRNLSCGVYNDFRVSTNFTEELVLHFMLPHFEQKRTTVNFGSLSRNGPQTRGRKQLLRSVDLLGLTLWFVKSKTPLYSLCPIFGVTDSRIGVWMNYGLEVLKRVVRDKDANSFEIRWPTVEEMWQSTALFENNRVNGPYLKGVFAVTDGGRMPCAGYTDSYLQSAYFEGFTKRCCCQEYVCLQLLWRTNTCRRQLSGILL